MASTRTIPEQACHGPRRALAASSAALLIGLIGCGGDPAGPPPPPPPAPVASVTVDPGTLSLPVGGTAQLQATPRDAGGNPAQGRIVTWMSLAPTIASVSTTLGQVTALAPGVATITATVEGRVGQATLTVLPPPVASVVVTPPEAALVVGGTVQLAASPRDADNNVLEGREVAWTSGDQTRATVHPTSGLVTALATGTVQITATSEGKSGVAVVTISATGAAPVISGILPATLIPGAIAIIAGTGFSPIPTENTVSVQGVLASVLSASAAQLQVIVPCVNTGTQEVRLSSAGKPAEPIAHPVATTQRALAVGQALVVTDAAGSACNEISFGGAGGRYLVTVFSNATSANALADFALHGNPAPAAAVAHLVASGPRAPAAIGPEEELLAAWDAAHFRILEQNRAILEAVGPREREAMQAAPQAVSPLPAVGDLRTLNFAFGQGCSGTPDLVAARAVYVGSRAIIWEDEANTLQTGAHPDYADFMTRLGQIYDQDQHAIIADHFGDPLRRDLDGDGRVHMLFTQRVNSIAAAFVTSCDQLPPASAPTSNFGEFFYGRVPTVAGSNPGSTTLPDGWFSFMMRTVVHEVKHIASHAARFANNAPVFEQSWLEEGTARHAEELWARKHLHQVQWKANTGFGTAAGNGVYCDFHVTDATCNANDPLRRPSWGVRRQFNEFRNRLLEPWNWSPFGDGNGQSGSVFYQVSWSLVRYAIDRFGASEAAFLGDLNQSNTNGVNNLLARAGVSLEELLGGWGLALFADDYPGLMVQNPVLQFATWDLRSIYAGLNNSPSWSAAYPSPFLLTPVQLPVGSFTTQRTGIRGGAHAYYEMVGTPGAVQLLNLRALNGAGPSPSLRVAIARLQ